jgi:type I restriction enzyme R subunit
MRQALVNLNSDLVQQHADYVCRVTAEEGDIGAAHRARFQDVETRTPVILTTSQLLTTGVDAPTCSNVVLARVVGSITEFKQIIGRGTRLREDYGKLFFTILDYTGTATTNFADPDFDGVPAVEITTKIDENGDPVAEERIENPLPEEPDDPITDHDPTALGRDNDDDVPDRSRKYYVDGGVNEIIHQIVYELDSDGRRLSARKLTDWTGEKVRTLYPTPAAFRADWIIADKRQAIVDELEERGIDLETLAESVGRPDDDPFDLLCHLGWNAPLRTRRERAERLRHDRKDFFDQYGPDAREVLEALLEKYAAHGAAQFVLPDTLKVPPIAQFGNVREISQRFSGPEKMRKAVDTLAELLYAS